MINKKNRLAFQNTNRRIGGVRNQCNMRKDQFTYYTAQRIGDKLDRGLQKILGAVLQTQA